MILFITVIILQLLPSGLPSREELLILALGLGGSGNNYAPIDRSGSFRPDSIVIQPSCVGCGRPGPSIVDNRRCPHNGRNGQICSNIPGA
jgi:hypothetical protein